MRVKIKSETASLLTSCLVNSRFESDEPELVIPEKVAELLKIRGSAIARFKTAGV